MLPSSPNVDNWPTHFRKDSKLRNLALGVIGSGGIFACCSILLVAAVTIAVVANANRPQNTIIGTWEQVGGVGEVLQFSNDGTITATSLGITGVGSYEFIDNDTIRINLPGIFSSSQIFDVQISDDTLTLSYNGTSVHYRRIMGSPIVGVGEPTKTEPKYSLARDIIGLWFTEGETAQGAFDFTDDGKCLFGREWLDYTVASENTILITLSDGTQIPLRVLERDRDRIKFQFSDEEIWFKHIQAIPDLGEKIVGTWVTEDEHQHILVFTQAGRTAGAGIRHGGNYNKGTYEVVNGNVLLITSQDPSENVDGPAIDFVVEVSEDRLVLRNPDFTRSLERVPPIAGLEKLIIGIWAVDYGPTLEFTDSGEFISVSSSQSQNFVMKYEVANGNILLLIDNNQIQGVYVVEDISDDVLKLEVGEFKRVK